MTPVAAAIRRFTGPMVLLLGPEGCSHIDQFAAMLTDNELGLSVGMPAGGCSNPWERDEVLTLPCSGRPLVPSDHAAANARL